MTLILILLILILIMNVASIFLNYSKIDDDDEDVRYSVMVILSIIMTIMSVTSGISIFQELKPVEQKYIECLQKTLDNQELKDFCKNAYLK